MIRVLTEDFDFYCQDWRYDYESDFADNHQNE